MDNKNNDLMDFENTTRLIHSLYIRQKTAIITFTVAKNQCHPTYNLYQFVPIIQYINCYHKYIYFIVTVAHSFFQLSPFLMLKLQFH